MSDKSKYFPSKLSLNGKLIPYVLPLPAPSCFKYKLHCSGSVFSHKSIPVFNAVIKSAFDFGYSNTEI